MVEKYVEKDIYVSRKNTVNYWCSKINIMITFNNGVSKSNKLLDNTQNEQSKFITSNDVEINDESWRTYNTSNQIKLKTSIGQIYVIIVIST